MTLQLIVVLVLVGGWMSGRVFSRFGLPGVLGMTLWGLVLNTLWGSLIPPVLQELAPFLKSLALVAILLRAGLGIRISHLRNVGWSAVKMAVVPSLFEAAVLVPLLHRFAGLDLPVAILGGILLAAVSPAVVVPSMLQLKDQGLGADRDIPTMLLTGASLDNVVVITAFTFMLVPAGGGEVRLWEALVSIPKSLALGIVPGLAAGFALVWFFRRYHDQVRATEKFLLLLGSSVMLLQVGDWTQAAALLGIMTVGFVLLAKAPAAAEELTGKLGKFWVFGEIVLFVLIGMSVSVESALRIGPKAILVILAGLTARSAGVLTAMIGSGLTWKERFFAVIAYWPKATVQAALGAVPLQRGIAGGETILAYAVAAILITTPMGLLGIRYGSRRLLGMDLRDVDDRPFVP